MPSRSARAFLLVWGASGSGKSSLAKAGVLPTLVKSGAVPGVGEWRCAVMKPSDGGKNPFLALAHALVRGAETAESLENSDIPEGLEVELCPAGLPELIQDGRSAASIAQSLKEKPESASELVRGAVTTASAVLAEREKNNLRAAIERDRKAGRSDDADAIEQRLADYEPKRVCLALILDQMEELFTGGYPQKTLTTFFQVLDHLAASGRVAVIGTLRSEFFSRCLGKEDFQQVLGATLAGGAEQKLAPPRPHEIGQMIRKPAQAAGVRFEETVELGKLDERIRDAAVQEPDSLPLLEFCLEKLYEEGAEDGLLEHAEYGIDEETPGIGQLEGVLERYAEEVFNNTEILKPHQREPLHAVLLQLATEGDGTRGESDALPEIVRRTVAYDELEDAYTGSQGFSKTLLFSSWVMVPRMVSTLVSYEVERQTVGNPETKDQQEAEDRTYFAKKRHPVPLIRYARRTREGNTQLVNMSNFTLLFPSQVLAGIAAPIENLKQGFSLGELRVEAKEEIGRRIEEAELERFITPGGEGERWYWAAPLLLDWAERSARESLEEWFEWGQQEAGNEELAEEDRDSDEFQGAKKDHYEFLKRCFEDPSLIGLGQPPEDLTEVLADLALGSPAVIALRSLRRLYGSEEEEASLLTQATRIADEFASLFNKPESIAAVRLSEKHEWYWRMVADYCASGCLQSVLDEYFHLLDGQNVNPLGAVDQLLGAINLNASSINVDSLDTFLSGQSKKMRCHYASEFGSQRIETDQGQKRASGLREVFNSPFRPFLLSTTSIGQEGLDFHSYCRRIVHWNLPGNPVDLEQREGRINRFKSLVIRQQIARKYGPLLAQGNCDKGSDIWEELFRIADREEREKAGKCELIPYWHVEADDDLRIERVIPLYPFSIDQSRLVHILKTLAIYRLAFGQPRQAELVDHLLERKLSQEEVQQVMDTLMINLSPIRYSKVIKKNGQG